MNRLPIIAYYGAFITDRVKAVRALPVLNHAATKRMLRVAQGLTSRERWCVVVSSGIAPRINSTWDRLDRIIERVEGVAVLTVAQFGVRFLGFLLTPLTAICAAISLYRKHKIDIVVQYNYYPDAYAFSLWCKLAYRAKVILDLEDVAVPRLSDWKRGSEARPIGEIWSWVFMKLSIALADIVFSPSRKLGIVVPQKKFTVVSGCQRVPEVLPMSHVPGKIRILLSGGIKFENGLDIFAGAVNIADQKVPKEKLEITVCGPGKYEWLAEKLNPLKHVSLKTLGFLSNAQFETIYQNIDLCLALQNPVGRYSNFKAPSKGYEALCSGKALIVGDIGDFDLLPDNVCYHLRPYSAECLADILVKLTCESVAAKRIHAHEYSREHFDSSLVCRRLLERLK